MRSLSCLRERPVRHEADVAVIGGGIEARDVDGVEIRRMVAERGANLDLRGAAVAGHGTATRGPDTGEAP